MTVAFIVIVTICFSLLLSVATFLGVNGRELSAKVYKLGYKVINYISYRNRLLVSDISSSFGQK